MEQFWQQDRLILSLEIVGILITLFAVVMLGISVSRHLRTPVLHLKTKLGAPRGILAFKAARLLLSLIGIATLIATFLPGLTPFEDRVDPNLGLGGFALIYLWPFIIVQIAVGLLPMERKLEPLPAWGLLIIGYFAGVSVCKTAIGLLYN